MPELDKKISDWIKDYADKNKIKTLVVGISGGIDSSVVSTLCAMTGLKTLAVTMPIRQQADQHDLSIKHGEWLEQNYNNVEHRVIKLDDVYHTFRDTVHEFNNERAWANTKSRLRMVTLYQIAGSMHGIVVGTGNKVEDFGVGFYTKYGDGGVDISPIADLMKSQVYELARDLKIDQSIIDAPPTDGLWEDGRTDHDQLNGLTYDQLERAMVMHEKGHIAIGDDAKVLEEYIRIRAVSEHKMKPIPVFKMQQNND